MTKDFAKEVIDGIMALYKNDPHARQYFDLIADRERDASATSIDRISWLLGITRGEAVALARRLEDAKCGEFVVGRRGQKSRFVWEYSCISLGKAAAGETSNLEQPENPLPEAEEETGIPAIAPVSQLTIIQAKEALAASLGVPVANIEITVRA